jgi:hypothetical protein
MIAYIYHTIVFIYHPIAYIYLQYNPIAYNYIQYFCLLYQRHTTGFNSLVVMLSSLAIGRL